MGPKEEADMRVDATRYLNTQEAAKTLGVSVAFLRRDRRRESPAVPCVKLGPRTYRYRVEALRGLDRRPRSEERTSC